MASSYGKGPYGNRLYSLAPTVDFIGNLTPQVSFAGSGLDVLVAQGDLAGNLRPAIVFLGASLTVDRAFYGDMRLGIVFGAPGLVSGPLWAPSTPCPPSMWTSEEPCDVDWQPSELCNG